MECYLLLGKAQESEIYLIIWEELSEIAESEIQKRLNDLKMKFTNCGYKTEILNEKQIIQLVNGFTNPDYAYIEDTSYLEAPLNVV